MRKKASLANAVLRSRVAGHLQEEFTDQLLLFTDSSADRVRNSASGTVTIRALGYNWSGRLSFATFSPIAELAAIRLES